MASEHTFSVMKPSSRLDDVTKRHKKNPSAVHRIKLCFGLVVDDFRAIVR